jgi:deazaflavin-dependent oxidoreductase (nitroreductase family)
MSPAKRSTITLMTLGRTSGKRRSATLYAFEDGEHLVVVGSRGGAARNPAWALNLRAAPHARVRSGGSEWDVRAREVEPGDERDRIWAVVTEAYPLYGSYQRRTTRLIPLFVLEPVEAG